MAALSPAQRAVAAQIEHVAMRRGVTPQHARELASAALAESGLNPRARNSSSGAAGLFQLLSPGYIQRAHGRVYNPVANELAILPDYQQFWRTHPGAQPGAAAAAVERSGKRAGFYAAGLAELGAVAPPAGGSATPGQPLNPGVRPSRPRLAGGPDRTQAILAALAQTVGQHTPDYSQVFSAFQQRAAQAAPPQHIVQAVAAGRQLAKGVENNLPPGHAPAPGASKIVALAKQYIGLPYKWGGTSPKTGFDCSGFAQWLYAHAGVRIPRTSQQQWHAGKPVERNALRPGDLVFFENTQTGPGHVGIYIGNNQFIESPHTGASIRISSLAGRTDYVGARRVGGGK